MYHNRISEYFSEQGRVETVVPEGFVVCPMVAQAASPWAQVTSQQDLYRQAREQAERQLAGERTSRGLFSSWN